MCNIRFSNLFVDNMECVPIVKLPAFLLQNLLEIMNEVDKHRSISYIELLSDKSLNRYLYWNKILG